jgi:hypothetical protein
VESTALVLKAALDRLCKKITLANQKLQKTLIASKKLSTTLLFAYRSEDNVLSVMKMSENKHLLENDEDGLNLFQKVQYT